MVEIVVVLAIIGILAGALIATMGGAKGSDNIDRAAQQIYNDLVFIRMRSVSTNIPHRINFTSTTSWQIESWDSAGSTWNNIDTVRNMPSATFLTSATQTNAADNLEAQPNGLYLFQDGAVGTPYVTIAGSGVTKVKSLTVALGGALSIDNN